MIRLDANEHIIKDCRKHWWAYIADVIVLSLAFLAPYIIWSLFDLGSRVEPTQLTTTVLTFAYMAWFTVVWVAFFIRWTNTFLDAWIVTDERIIDIDQVDFFRREVRSFRYERIQDVTVETPGFFASVLHFGNIQVRTAGTNEDLKINTVPDPEHLRELINDAHDKFVESHHTHP